MTARRELWQVDGYNAPEEREGFVRLSLFTHAPMPAQLRNEVVTDYYRRWARHLHSEIGATSAANWFAWAAWVSAEVGTQMSRWWPSRRRLQRALAAGNTAVFYDVISTFMAEYGRDGGTGSGAGSRSEGQYAEAAEIDERADPDAGEATAERGPGEGTRPRRARLSEAIACYESARHADEPRKSQLVLLGNCHLAICEQSFLDDEVAIAFRVGFRRMTTPPHQRLWSQRRWRATQPGALRLRVENAYVRLATARFISLATPFGTIRPGSPGSSRLPVLPRHRDGSSFDSPFDTFPPQPGGVRCWIDLRDRMGFINWLFASRAADPAWWDGQELALPPEWLGYLPLWRAFVDRYLRGPASPSTDTGLPAGYEVDLDDARARPANDGEDHARLTQLGVDLRVHEVAAATYRRHRDWLVTAFLARSLPDSFAAAKGAAVLMPRSVDVDIDGGGDVDRRPSSLRGDAALRTRRTLDFVDGMFGVGDADDGDTAAEGVDRVRHRHAHHRRALVDADWDTTTLGEPINQEDMLGTVCTFVEPPMRMFAEHLPGRIRDSEWNAWAAAWCDIGCSLGLDPAFVTIVDDGVRRYVTAAELARIAHVIRRRQHARSVAGVQLMGGLLEDLEDAVPRPLSPFVSAAVAAFGDPELNRLLIVPPSRIGETLGASSRRLARVPGLRHLLPVLLRPLIGWALRELERAQRQCGVDTTATFPATCADCSPR